MSDPVNSDQYNAYKYAVARVFTNWLYMRMGRWEEVGDFFEVSKATAWRVGNDPDYIPKDDEIRQRFAIKPYASVVTVNGKIPEGSYSLGAMSCVDCDRWYISNHPRRKKCFICSPFSGKKR